jgi:hypothetical protein
MLTFGIDADVSELVALADELRELRGPPGRARAPGGQRHRAAVVSGQQRR